MQRDLQFTRQAIGVKGAASEVTTFDFDCRYFAETIVHPQDKLLGIGFFVDIDLAELDTALAQELFSAAAVATPACSVNDDLRHFSYGIRKEVRLPRNLIISWVGCRATACRFMTMRERNDEARSFGRSTRGTRRAGNAGLRRSAHSNHRALDGQLLLLPLGAPSGDPLEFGFRPVAGSTAAVDVDLFGLL